MARSTERRSRKRSSSASGDVVASGRVTRQRTRTRLAESLSNTAVLKDMVGEAAGPAGTSTREAGEMGGETQESRENVDLEAQTVDTRKGKGKGKARVVEDTTVEAEKGEPCFRLMDLPTEIRLEIYRACLTRPYKILLSRVEQTPPAREDIESETIMRSVNDAAERLALPGPSQPNVQSATAGPLRRVPAGRNTLRQVRRLQATAASAPPALGVQNQLAGPAAVNSSNHPVNTAQPDFSTQPPTPPIRRNHASPDDPLIINLLRTSKQIYKEARDVLYSENVFDLSIATAVPSLAALHQRSRSHLKHIELEIPTYTEILERFSEIVRLSLRYCKGLKKFVIHTPFALPGADGSMTSSNTTVYANGFDILRWLPQQCEVVLQGTPNAEIDAVVQKHLSLAKAQDERAYIRRQMVSNDSSTTTSITTTTVAMSAGR